MDFESDEQLLRREGYHVFALPRLPTPFAIEDFCAAVGGCGGRREDCRFAVQLTTGLTEGVLVENPTIVIRNVSAIALRTLTVAVVRAGSILQREAGRLFRAFSISAAQFNVIILLADRPKGVRASELAVSLVVDPSSTTYLLDQLEERGLAVRHRDPEDRRALKIVLTSKGRLLHAKLIPIYHQALQRMAESFEPAELARALPFLEKLPAAAVDGVDGVIKNRERLKPTGPKKKNRGT